MIKINGITITGNAKNVSIQNGKIIIDGRDVTPDAKQISIEINGSIESLSADACDTIKVQGNANMVKTMSGDINIAGFVNGDVKTMSGDVKCAEVKGSVSTMSGDIRRN